MRILAECRWFRQQGFRCVLMAKPGSPVLRAFLDDGFEAVPMRFTRGSQAGDWMRCVREFRRLKPLMVGTHSNVDTRVALAAAACTGVPRRVRYRHVSIPVRGSPWNRVIYRKLANRVVTTARSIADDLVREFRLPPCSVASIPTGVRMPEEGPDVRNDVLSQLGISQGGRLIVQVSVLRGWKGHEHLMEAFERLAVADPSLHLVIVGGGNQEEALRKKAASLSAGARVHFTGQVVDPYPYFMSADVVTLASTSSEGVPQSALQAFACGRPFVGTRVGGIPDVVSHGKNGLLVPPGDAGAMAAAIRGLLDDGEFSLRLGVAARETFAERGTLSVMGSRLRDFLGV